MKNVKNGHKAGEKKKSIKFPSKNSNDSKERAMARNFEKLKDDFINGKMTKEEADLFMSIPGIKEHINGPMNKA